MKTIWKENILKRLHNPLGEKTAGQKLEWNC